MSDQPIILVDLDQCAREVAVTLLILHECGFLECEPDDASEEDEDR